MDLANGPFPTKSVVEGTALPVVEATALGDIAGIVEKAREAQVGWAEIPAAKRIRAIARVKQRVLSRAEEIAALVRSETGKPEVEALLGEVVPTADVVAYWSELLPDELEPYEAEIDAFAYPKKRGWVHREPRGVIALVTPWNFPFALPLRTIVPALMAGNAVVLKPSEVTARTGKLVVDLFDGLVPAGLLALVQGGGDAGARLVESGVDFVSFIGSPRTGRAIALTCAERLIPSALELGGKDAAIVLGDADLDRAANGIVWGAMMNAGQNCGAVERVYVVKSAAEALTKKIVDAANALRPGEDVGPLTTATQRAIVARHVKEAEAAGAKVLTGGSANDEEADQHWRPTVMTLTSDDTPLVADETFGPVVPILAVESAEEAIRRANASRYGLTASLWTADVAAGERLAGRLRAGVVTINNHAFTGAVPSMPWGGVGESGWGVTGSPYALDSLTRPRLVLVDRSAAVRETWWFPYSPALRRLAVAIAALRGGAATLGDRLKALFTLLGTLPTRRKELRSGKAESQ